MLHFSWQFWSWVILLFECYTVVGRSGVGWFFRSAVSLHLSPNYSTCQWLREPDADRSISSSLWKHWSDLKDYIRDVSFWLFTFHLPYKLPANAKEPIIWCCRAGCDFGDIIFGWSFTFCPLAGFCFSFCLLPLRLSKTCPFSYPGHHPVLYLLHCLSFLDRHPWNRLQPFASLLEKTVLGKHSLLEFEFSFVKLRRFKDYVAIADGCHGYFHGFNVISVIRQNTFWL